MFVHILHVLRYEIYNKTASTGTNTKYITRAHHNQPHMYSVSNNFVLMAKYLVVHTHRHIHLHKFQTNINNTKATKYVKFSIKIKSIIRTNSHTNTKCLLTELKRKPDDLKTCVFTAQTTIQKNAYHNAPGQ